MSSSPLSGPLAAGGEWKRRARTSTFARFFFTKKKEEVGDDEARDKEEEEERRADTRLGLDRSAGRPRDGLDSRLSWASA